MMALTHIAVGGASALLLAHNVASTQHQALWCVAGGIVGSLLPDIDHPNSWIGRRIPFVSIPLSSLVGHRGITHSMIALIAIQAMVLAAVLSWRTAHGAWLAPFLTGLGLGYASHLLADWLSNTGIPLLWPNKRRFAAPLTIQTGSAIEYLLALGVYAWFASYALKWLGHA